jgi:carbon monoxide dehydrogenase subunit G
MPSLERSVHIARPPELVWDFLSDFTTTEQWDPPTRETVRVEGDGGLGTVYRNRSRLLGQDARVTYTVVDHDPPQVLRLRGDAGRVQFLDTIEVEPVDGGTRVRYTVEYRLHGLARLAAPLFGRTMRKVADDAARQMGTVLDGL